MAIFMSGYSINVMNIDEIYAMKTDLGNNTQLMESSVQLIQQGMKSSQFWDMYMCEIWFNDGG